MIPERLQAALRHGIVPGLERTSALLERMGRPQDGLRIVHVAGTNGKGSVCAFLSAILRAAGLKVARYTSPHLVDYVERFWCDGQFISPSAMEAWLERLHEAAKGLDPDLGPATEFELLTAVAFGWFREQAPDVVLLEVGLGGRLDATNVIDRPLVSVITRIALDHTALLGETEVAIAREKAGILRPGVPAVLGAQGEALTVIRGLAETLGSPLHLPDLAGIPQDASLGLAGPHQRLNAAIALRVVDLLRDQALSIPDEAVREGLQTVHWPGRLDRWHLSPAERFCFDGAHNVDGVRALVQALHMDPDPVGRVLLVGMLADKQVREMLPALAGCAEAVVVTKPPSPRAWDPTTANGLVSGRDLYIRPDWQEALALARQLADGREVVVAGSLYLVGAVYSALGRKVEP
jgi:dihydrofolate synthase/folylpolyglutamate synthase